MAGNKGKAGRRARNGQRPANRRRRQRVPRPLAGIVQGVGAVPNASALALPNVKYAFDATHPTHLPLPRAVGSYTVLRTTSLISTSEACVLLGPFMKQVPGTGEMKWSNICAMTSDVMTNPINGAANTHEHIFDQMAVGTGFDKCTVTPAAFTVQVMNGEALQTTNGIVQIGRLRTMPRYADDTTTWQAKFSSHISYNQPRLCSAAKLALRGVKVSCVPYDMNAMANFTSIAQGAGGTVTWGTATEYAMCEGLAPIFIYSPGQAVLDLLVTCEWRVRFDPENPAQASHAIHHPPSESFWSRAVDTAGKLGHGVEDIAENVANFGETVARGVKSAGQAFLMGKALKGMLQGATTIAESPLAVLG